MDRVIALVCVHRNDPVTVLSQKLHHWITSTMRFGTSANHGDGFNALEDSGDMRILVGGAPIFLSSAPFKIAVFKEGLDTFLGIILSHISSHHLGRESIGCTKFRIELFVEGGLSN
jgi:hypothetical protein